MRKFGLVVSAIVVCVLMGVGVESADSKPSKKKQSPDSIVTCEGSGGDFGPRNVTVPASVSRDDCTELGCATCIRSLEEQGCQVVDVVITNWAPAGGTFPDERQNPRTTFLLSCEKP